MDKRGCRPSKGLLFSRSHRDHGTRPITEFEDSPLSKRRVVVAARIRARQWYLGNLEIQWKLSRVEGSTIAEEVAAAAAAMASGAARSRQREDGCLRVHTHTRGRRGWREEEEEGGEERQSRGVLHVSLQRGVDPK